MEGWLLLRCLKKAAASSTTIKLLLLHQINFHVVTCQLELLILRRSILKRGSEEDFHSSQ